MSTPSQEDRIKTLEDKIKQLEITICKLERVVYKPIPTKKEVEY